MNLIEFKIHVVDFSLQHIDLYSENASWLLLKTAVHESRNFTHLKQVKGPALGLYQVEPPTLDDTYDNFLDFPENEKLQLKVDSLMSVGALMSKEIREYQLIGNLFYATAIARLKYWRCPDPLPDHKDYQAVAQYWKDHYNTSAGKGTVEAFLTSQNRAFR